MDKLYFVEDIRTDRMNYANELSQFDHDVANVSRSPFPELMDKNMVKGVEKRAHKRFQVNKDAFALIRSTATDQLCVTDRSMAETAFAVYRSKPVRFGRIDNISIGGLSFRYITGEKRSDQSLVLDILVAESGFYLENMRFKNIADFEIADDLAVNSFRMRLNRVQFEGLEPPAIMKLKQFVGNYSESSV